MKERIPLQVVEGRLVLTTVIECPSLRIHRQFMDFVLDTGSPDSYLSDKDVRRLQIPMKDFQIYSVPGVIVWNIFWGTLVFSLGTTALQIVGLKYVLIIFAVWVAIILLKTWVARRNSRNATTAMDHGT